MLVKDQNFAGFQLREEKNPSYSHLSPLRDSEEARKDRTFPIFFG